MTRKLTILFSGMLAGDPHQGGATWAVLQYLLGFRDLGHDVYFVEPVSAARLQPDGTTLQRSYSADYFRKVIADFHLEGSSALLLDGTRETVGLPYEQLRQVARGCDVVFNVSGMLTDPALLAQIPRRVYLDLDPAFIQMWSAYDGIDMRFDGHTHFVTVGREIGKPGCEVPTCGRMWIPTFQPVVLSHWPQAARVTLNAWTTIGNWRGYGSITHGGVRYGQKAHSMRDLFDLPKLTHEKFAPAFSIDPGETQDLAALKENGWDLLDPAAVASNPRTYQSFVQSSRGEFGVAKSGYVLSRCGWFSDRSACYLASGRPVMAQETGFSKSLPTGEGLFAFSTREDVLEAIEAVARDYDCHARAARAIAVEHFDSDRVLGRLLEAVGAG